jgi:hypothetical protein
MKKSYLLGAAAILSLGVLNLPQAHAGAKLEINENSNIDLGFRVQALYLNNDSDLTNNTNEFKLRRARFRLKGNVTKYFTGFLQTEFSDDGINSGGDMRLIDGWVMAKPHKLANVVAGMAMAPVTRMGMTTSGALMTIDRPGINNYMLTWGGRGRVAFNTGSLAGTRNGLGGDVQVRDLGVTLFGKTSFTDTAHFKYYLGVYEGQDPATRVSDSERFSGRVQFNFFDAESGMFNASTYLGKKKTIGIGAGYDTQSDVAIDSVTRELIDYSFYTVDAFMDYPVGPGSLTAEAAYSTLDLSDALNPLANEKTGDILSGAVAADQSQGSGFYAQAGYYINQWQPWVGYEQWDADAANGGGDWEAFRFGVSYFLSGHNANIKAGYEVLKNDTPGENDIDTFVIGMYMTY